MDEKIFYVGQTFENKEEILRFFKEFCSTYSEPLTIRNSSVEKILFKCCHGRKQKSTGTGQRPNQHYLFKNCGARINIYKGKKNYWQVTKVDLEHNHKIGRVEYDMYGRRKKLDAQDYRLMSDLMKAKAKNSIIRDVLKKKNNKVLTVKDIQNIKSKLFSLSSKEREGEFKNLLIKVVEENGRCTITYDNDGTMKAIFIATGVMIDSLRKCQPPVVQMDLSLEFDAEHFDLLVFSYYSSLTGKSEFAALGFIFREESEILIACFEEFRQINVNDPLILLVDKDCVEITTIIRDVFPMSVILLNKFHVLKCMKELLSSAFACHTATKENLFEMFEKMMYSQTAEEYAERKIDLLIIADEVEVNAGKNKYVTFKDQFNSDWDSCKQMWVYCYRKNLPWMEVSTTNRIERSFQSLKTYINENFHRVSNRCESIVALVDFVTRRLSNSISSITQKVFKIIDKNPKIRTLLNRACLKLNIKGLKLLQESLVSLEALKAVEPGNERGVLKTCDLYKTDMNSCDCEFWKSHEAPCQHILYLKDILNVELCIEKCFHKRYLLTETTDNDIEPMESMNVEDIEPENVNICDDGNNDEEMETLVDNEDSEGVSVVTQELNEVVRAHSGKKCLEYVEELKKFINLVRQGESVAVISQSSQSQRCKLTKSQSTESSILDKKAKIKGKRNARVAKEKIKAVDVEVQVKLK